MWEFLLGIFFGSGLVMWLSGIGISSDRVQEKIKKAYQKGVFHKKAEIIKKVDIIDEVLK